MKLKWYHIVGVLVGGAIIYASYRLSLEYEDRTLAMKNAVDYAKQKDGWILNIACGRDIRTSPSTIYDKTINMDIKQYIDAEMPNFEIGDIYNIHYPDKIFASVMCSHTLEHLDDPERALQELHRVAERVYIVVPQSNVVVDSLCHEHLWQFEKKGVWAWNDNHFEILQHRIPLKSGIGVI